ncbi:MAG TPA: hypothetical protein DCZ93_07950, partial [Elusimicrobia bacterium]|nr:hypothetical protein [Elusimicrobiota bacterium]
TTGNDNIFLGFKAGYNVTAGTGNIIIGYEKTTPAAGTNNYLNIGGLIAGDMALSSVTVKGNLSAARYQINGSTVLAILPGIGSLGVGINAGRISTGGYNVFVGSGTGYTNSTGGNNSFVGYKAGYANTTGWDNAFLGVSAGERNTTGSYNAFVGSYAGVNNTTGINNSFVGVQAGAANTEGDDNAFFGGYAGNYNTTGYGNSFFGYSAGERNTTGVGNSAVGYYAGRYNQTGWANAILGREAGHGVQNNSFSSSTLMGYQAGYGLTTGGDNIFLGFKAGYSVTTGTGNIIIGYNKTTPAATTNNHLNIGNIIYGNLSTGNVGIGTNNPSSAVEVQGSASDRFRIMIQNQNSSGRAVQEVFNDWTNSLAVEMYGSAAAGALFGLSKNNLAAITGSGADAFAIGTDVASPVILGTANAERLRISATGNVGIGTASPGNILTIQQTSVTDPIADAWTIYSSRRWKTNIQPLTGALDKVKALEGVYFDWKAGGRHDLGMIAEDVGKVIPELVAYEENGVDARSVDYARLTAVLVEAVKEQQKHIENQQKEIESLKSKVMKLEKGDQ